MKFKKSISFALTLCMVLSLFATFVIPASAEATNLAAGKNYTVSQQFRQGGAPTWGWDDNADISYPDDGVKLTDGVTQPASDALGDPAWAGFNANCPDYANAENKCHKITVDLGEVCEINEVSMYLASSLVAPGAGISYKYAWVSIFVSNDNENWTNVGYTDVGDNEVTDACAGKVTVTLAEAASAQYVQFRVTKGGWLFVSEVEVYGTAAAEEDDVLTWEDGWINDPADTNPDDGQNLKFDNAYGYTFVLDADKVIGGEDNVIITNVDDYNACNPNWAISVLLAPEGDLFKVVKTVATPGSAAKAMEAGINFDNGNIVLIAHSSASHDAYPNWQAKLCALALKEGDLVKVSETEAYVLIPGVDEVPEVPVVEAVDLLPGEGATVTGGTLTVNADGSVTITVGAEGKAEVYFVVEDGKFFPVTGAYAVYDYGTLGNVTKVDTKAEYTRKDKGENTAQLYISGMNNSPNNYVSSGEGWGVWSLTDYITGGKLYDDGVHAVKDMTYYVEGDEGASVTFYTFCVSPVAEVEGLGSVRPVAPELPAEPGIEIVLPEGTGITIPDGYGATDILLDGYTGVGEITAHDGNHDKLVCLRNGTTDVESEYSLKVTLDKETAFNVVTLYILSHTGGNVGLPKAVTVNINGVDYEAEIAGEDASVVAIEVKLEEAVSATGFTVDVVMNSGNVKYNMYSEIAVSLVEDDDESYKDTYVHADGVNVGTIQQLGEAWADKLTLDFWYLVEEDDATVTVSVVADDKVVLENDTQLRVWVDADMSDKTRTTLFDVKVIDGVATVVRADNYDAAVKSVSYEVIGKDYKLVLVLDKAALTIDGEYGLNVQLGQSNSTTMHSIKYDNVTGEGATYAPWTTTEFYEVFGKAPEAPVTSQVVTDWNPDKWGNSFGGATGAFIYTDADIYADADILWWRHVAFKPSAVAGVYEVAAVRAPSEDPYLTIPEGGFVWTAWSSAGDTPESSGAYALAFMGDLKVGDFVYFVGVDFAAQTTTVDATAITVESIMDLNLLVSHNYNYNWHCFEGQFITNTIADANGNYLVKAGDAPNMSIAEEDILYVVELVDGAYLVTAFVTGTAIADVVIPDGGFLYYITANCTGYESVSKGELVGSYLLIGDINLNSSFAIDTQAGQAAYAISAVKSGKVFDIGDLNLNGEIDATDYAILRKLVLGTLTAEDIGDIAYARADVNGDKVVNARDYYLVKRAFLGTYVIPGWEDDAE